MGRGLHTTPAESVGLRCKAASTTITVALTTIFQAGGFLHARTLATPVAVRPFFAAHFEKQLKDEIASERRGLSCLTLEPIVQPHYPSGAGWDPIYAASLPIAGG